MVRNEEAILRLERVSVAYGRNEAVREISLEVWPGELVTLLGANGSGKSTVLKAILGLQPVRRGRIHLLGRNVTRMPAEKIVALGAALVPEGRGVLGPMSVAENLELGAYHRREDLADSYRDVYRRFPILEERKNQQAGTLSGGQQQMLVIARAMMAAPKLLLLDEPSLGLAPIIVTELFRTIGRLKEDGYTIVLSEQNARQALTVADRGYVFETGRIIMAGPTAELSESDTIRRAYLGGQNLEAG